MNGKICSDCQIELKIHINDVAAVEMASYGPLAVWSADEYVCPQCQRRVLLGFGKDAEIRTDCEHYLIALINNKRRRVVPFWLNLKEKVKPLEEYLDDFAKKYINDNRELINKIDI